VRLALGCGVITDHAGLTWTMQIVGQRRRAGLHQSGMTPPLSVPMAPGALLVGPERS